MASSDKDSAYGSVGNADVYHQRRSYKPFAQEMGPTVEPPPINCSLKAGITVLYPAPANTQKLECLLSFATNAALQQNRANFSFTLPPVALLPQQLSISNCINQQQHHHIIPATNVMASIHYFVHAVPPSALLLDLQQYRYILCLDYLDLFAHEWLIEPLSQIVQTLTSNRAPDHQTANCYQ